MAEEKEVGGNKEVSFISFEGSMLMTKTYMFINSLSYLYFCAKEIREVLRLYVLMITSFSQSQKRK